MKYAFDVKGKPELFRALQEKGITLGRGWVMSPAILGWTILDLRDVTEYFYFDSDEMFFGHARGLPECHMVEGESSEQRRSRYQQHLQIHGYKLNAFDEFFAQGNEMIEMTGADKTALSDRSAAVCGVLTQVSNVQLWRLCNDKLEQLDFTCTNRKSVPSDAMVIDLKEKTYRDVCINSEWEKSLNYEQVQWINIADLLAWQQMLAEADALDAYIDMFRSGKSEKFVELLSVDFRYSSQNVFQDLTSKYAFKEYIRGKLETLRKSGSTVVGKVGKWHDRPCLVLTQKIGQERFELTVFATVLGGMITSISVCMVPTPEEVRFTG